MAQQRIGMIGLDTSHCAAFTNILHTTDDPNHVPGAQVVAGFPGETADWPKSADRVQGFTDKLRDEFGVEICDSPEAVAEKCDLIVITSCDGRKHRGFVERVVGYGKPVFVDKPFATTVEDAEAIITAAQQHNVPLMSCSALRYASPLQAALADDALGAIRGIDVWGPMALDEALTGLFWYGCHGIEMIVTAMGAGCREVRGFSNDGSDNHTLVWDDGRVATYRGIRDGHKKFGATIHREEGFQTVDILAAEQPFYVHLLKAILGSLPNGRSDVPTDQMLDVVSIMVAANTARENGSVVAVDAPTAKSHG